MKVNFKGSILSVKLLKPKLPMSIGLRKRWRDNKRVFTLNLFFFRLEATIERKHKTMANCLREIQAKKEKEAAKRIYQKSLNTKLKNYDAHPVVYKQVKSSCRRGNR